MVFFSTLYYPTIIEYFKLSLFFSQLSQVPDFACVAQSEAEKGGQNADRLRI
jgi:hypothetical protein